ncbi:hypothetical protein FOMPIDRAFT_1129236, partial [Fomitopsis schrenkii]
ALYVCDRCFTIDQEVRYIWQFRRSSVSALYMTLQASTIVYFLLNVVQELMTLPCDRVLTKCELVITSLRVYAVSGGGRTVSIVVFGLSLVIVANDIVRRMLSHSPNDELMELGLNSSKLRQQLPLQYRHLSVAQSGPPSRQATKTIADTIVVIITWCKTYNIVQRAREANIPASFAEILLRDGQHLVIFPMTPHPDPS